MLAHASAGAAGAAGGSSGTASPRARAGADGPAPGSPGWLAAAAASSPPLLPLELSIKPFPWPTLTLDLGATAAALFFNMLLVFAFLQPTRTGEGPTPGWPMWPCWAARRQPLLARCHRRCPTCCRTHQRSRDPPPPPTPPFPGLQLWRPLSKRKSCSCGRACASWGCGWAGAGLWPGRTAAACACPLQWGGCLACLCVDLALSAGSLAAVPWHAAALLRWPPPPHRATLTTILACAFTCMRPRFNPSPANPRPQDGAYWGSWFLSHWAGMAASGTLCALVGLYPFAHSRHVARRRRR